MNQTWENGKYPNFGPNFGPFGPNLGPQNFSSWVIPLLDVKHCRKLSLYPRNFKNINRTSRKHMIQTQEIGKKPHFESNLRPLGPNSGPDSSSVTRYHGHLSSCTISKKTNDSILKKCSDGRTDRQTHESDFIGRCPTRVERSIKIKHPYIHKLKSLRKKLFKLTSITAKNLTLK